MPDSATGRSERWRRFSILDFLLLFPAFALGFALIRMYVMRPDAQKSLQEAAPSLFSRGTLEMVLGGLVLGSVLAAPIILTSQWILHRRRTGLSAGEWLWLLPLANYLLAWTASYFAEPAPAWLLLLLVLFLGVQACFSQVAVIGLLIILLHRHGDVVDHRWTNAFGCASCAATGVLVGYAAVVECLRL